MLTKWLCDYVDGSSYAFTKLTIEDQKDVEDLGNELQTYEHLQDLQLKGNGIRDLSSIGYLQYLL